jgi:hypothetical protein
MDEYLFTLLAKLKADRLKLQKAARDREIEALDDYYSSARRSKAPSPSARRSDSLPELSAIVSAHGLRGWS